MDAAQKILKTSALLRAIALLAIALPMAAPGWAQQPVLLAPSSVSIGSSGSNSALVTSSTAGTTEIAYTIGSPNYSGDTTGAPSGWLFDPSGSATTPSNLNFSVRTASGLSQGSSCTVTLTPTGPAGVSLTPVVITIVFNGAGTGGGGSNILTASQNPVPLNAAPNSSTSTNVNITTSSVSAITISVIPSGTSGGITWLGVSSVSSNTISSSGGASITITANSSNLVSGVTYQGTVTVTPSTGTALNITVNFTVGSGGSNGTWTANPSSIPFNFTTNSGNFPSQSVAVTTTSGQFSYNVNTTSSNGWLVLLFNGGDVTSITGLSVGSQFTVQIGANANALSQGQYTGQAIVSDSNGNQQVTVTVTLTVNGGNSSGLGMTPNPVPFSLALNSAQQSQVVTVSSNVGGTVTVGPSGSTPGWLSATGPSPSTIVAGQNATFTVTANPAGLLAGSYTANIAVTVGAQSGTLTVNLLVGGGGIGTGTTGVAPTSLNISYEFGTNPAFAAHEKLVITGPQGNWSSVISSTSPWLNLSPSGGVQLPNPAVDGDTPIVSIDPTNLTIGSYSGNITITTPGGSQVVTVSLNVLSSTILLPTPGAVIFTAQTGQANPSGQSVFFSGSDNSLNPLGISATSNNTWISVVATTPTSVVIQVDQTGMGTGLYSGSVSVSQSGAANSPITVPVLLVINGGSGSGGTGTLSFSQNPIQFTSVNGVTSPSSTVLTVSSNFATSFVGSLSYQPTTAGNWLSVNPLSSVTTTNLSVSANSAGLAVGTYSATISFNVNGVIQTVGVTLSVTSSSVGNSGNVTVSPTSLSFTSQAGGSIPGSQILSVSSASGASGVTFTTQVTGSWLSVNPNGSSTTPSTLTVSVNSNALPAGPYTGNILITPTGGTAVNVPVTLTITVPPSVSAAPTALTFNYRAGDSAPASQPLTISGAGAALAFSVTPSSNGNWLVVSPAAGTTPATVNVSINPTGLSTGIYNGSILVAGAGGAPGSTTIGVTLNVTAPLPTITKLTNAASYATGSLAPGEIITLFAGDPTHPIGPATAAGLALDSTGKVSTTIGGVQVLIGGFACPMVYASATQVSAVVPYELKLFTTATVQVKFLGQTSNGVVVNVATTAPGIFTANSSGTGPGAILNSNSTTNSAANPAVRGDTVVVYLTGEGETSPAGVTGKVTTVAAPPQPLTPGPLLQPTITVGGQPANFSFAGEAPTYVSGVLQLNVTIPTNIAAGDQPLVVSFGGNPSQTGVTVSVR